MAAADKTAIAVFKTAATKLQKKATKLVITDDDQLNNAAALLGSVKGEQKALKAQKKKIIDPMKEALTEIKDLFAEPEGILADIEELVKAGMLEYHDKKDAAAQKAINSINNRVEKGTMRIDTAMAKLSGVDQAAANIQTGTGGAQFKQGPQKVRVTDVAALLKARPDLLLRERVLEALRMEVAADVRQDLPCPAGAELYREKTVAGIAG